MRDGCVPWPAQSARRYRDAGHWRGQTLGALLGEWAARYGDRIAVVDGANRWSYRDLDDGATRLAAGLVRQGLRAGDHLVVHLPNRAEFLVMCFALFRIGALPVFALPAHRRVEIDYFCRYVEASGYVIPDRHDRFDHRDLADEIREAVPSLRHVVVVGDPGEHRDQVAYHRLVAGGADGVALPQPDPTDVAFFLPSGGTTGLPKLIPRTHDDYAYNIRLAAANAGLDESSVYLAVLPVAHNYALGCPGVLGTLSVGGRVVLTTDGNPDAAFRLIEQERVTVTGLVPPLALVWADAASAAASRPDLSSLQLVQVGGAAVTSEAARRIRAALGCRLQQSFGMAEGLLSQNWLDDPEEITLTTQGRPLSPDDEVRIVAGDDRPVPPGEVGHLQVRGPYTFCGYYRAPEHNARSFTADGFFRTGDLARFTATGHLVIEGRVKDVINKGGEKVPAEEVENHLLAHPAVGQVALVAMPDPVMGERGCAFVVPHGEPPRLGTLSRFLRQRGLAAYKVPDRLEIVAALPQTAMGKVDKAALRERAASLVGAQPGAAQPTGAAG